MALIAGLALIKLVLHFAFNGRYGYQRDELYFIACGEHLDWGYVDIGPLTPWLGRLMREALGESLFALRFTSAVAGALTVFLTGWLARYLGGKRFAQAIAALCVIIAPVWLQAGNILALPSSEPLFWVSCACLIAVIFKTGRTRLWTAVGAVAGVGLLNKPSMAFFGVGLVIGLLLTRQRRHLADKWLWGGGLIALVLASPFILWQATHGWATWEFVHGMNRDLMAQIPRWLFLLGQVVYQHPFTLPIWVAGLGWLFFARQGEPYRALGWTFLFVFTFLLTAKSKIYYLAPAYPMLLASGAVAVESFIERHHARWPKAAIPVALLAGGLATMPVALPILPIEKMDGYVRTMTFGTMDKVYEVTGTWHDQFGWKEQAEAIADVYRALAPEEQADCMIIVGNFGEAGAIDFYGPDLGLPPATSIHQNYFFWGPGTASGQLAIAYGIGEDFLGELFGNVEHAATLRCRECLPYEDNVAVYICRKPKIDLRKAWDTFRMIAFSNTGVSAETVQRLREALDPFRTPAAEGEA